MFNRKEKKIVLQMFTFAVRAIVAAVRGHDAARSERFLPRMWPASPSATMSRRTAARPAFSAIVAT